MILVYGMSQSGCLKKKCVFIPNNIPSHICKLAYELFEYEIFSGEKVTESESDRKVMVTCEDDIYT